MKVLPHLLGWIALVAAAVALALANPGSGRDPGTVSSILAYPLDEPFRFALEPGETEVLLRTWLVGRRDTWSGDPRVIERWCLDLALEDHTGARVREWRAWTASRTSLEEDADGRLRPRVWTNEPDEAVTLGRTTRVDLRDLVSRGGILSVRAGCLSPGDRVLAMASRLGERTALARLRLEETDGAELRQELTGRVGASRWADLPATWRSALLGSVWDRLGALPPATGGVNPTVRLSASLEPAADASAALLLPPGGVAAWNLRGPVSFFAEWSLPDGSPVATATASARAVRADGTVEALAALPGGALGPWRFEDPLVSVQIALAPESPPLRVRAHVARADADPAWGAPPHAETAPGRYVAGPELVTVEAARVTTPLTWPVEPGEVARLAFRVPLARDSIRGFPSPEEPTPVPGCAAEPCVTVEALSAAGEVLTAELLALHPVPAPFERYVLGDTPATAAVGDAGTRVYVLPAGAARIRVGSATPVDVAVRVGEGVEETAEPAEYALPDGVRLRRRYAPLEREGWRARGPDGFEDLAVAGRIVRFDAQVRLEPGVGAGVSGGPGATAAEWHTLVLDGPYQLVAEPSSEGTHVRLGSTPVAVTVPADGRLPVSYRVEPGLVGREVTFAVGGMRISRVLAAAADVLEVGPLPPGPARVGVSGEGLFLARAEGAASGPAWRVRRVWQAEDGAERTIEVPPGGGGLSLHVLLPRGASGWLGWAVEAPETPSGGYSALTERTGVEPLVVDPGAEVSPLTFAGAPLASAVPVILRFADDLPSGARVRIFVHGPAVSWIRATATFAEPPAVATQTRHWRRSAPR